MRKTPRTSLGAVPGAGANGTGAVLADCREPGVARPFETMPDPGG